MSEAKIDLAMLSILETPMEDHIIFKWAQQQLGDDIKVQKFQQLYMDRKKSKSTAHILNIIAIFGLGGLHRFYLGDIVLGLAHLCTLGFCFAGTFVDIFNINKRVNSANTKVAMQTLEMVRMM